MLSTDLIRTRMFKGEVRPSYIDARDPKSIEFARDLIQIFVQSVGSARGELDDALAAHIGEGTDFVFSRGLARLLLSRTTLEVDAPCDPIELRRRVFELSARSHPVALVPGDRIHTVTRADVLSQVATSFGLTTEVVDRALYADLETAHMVRAFEPLSAESLLERYNLALAQAVLLRASRLTITIEPGDPARYRQLFRFIRFFRLMHTVHGDRARGYTLTLDGPMSLFQLSSKYGLQMAEFLPALILCSGWTLHADLAWGKLRKPATFRLSPKNGLVSHYRDQGVYVTDEERFFVERFARLETPWRLEKKPEIVDLDGRGVLIPDFVLRHGLDGREALLEIVGFWRKGYLESRLELLKSHGPKNLILAVSKRLQSSDEEWDALPGEVIFFKDILSSKDVLEKAEQIGIATGAPVSKKRTSRPRKERAVRPPSV